MPGTGNIARRSPQNDIVRERTITRLLITGASGLLGANLALELADDYQVSGLVNTRLIHSDRFEVLQHNLLDEGACEDILDQTRPDVVIHCAGLTEIDHCERQPEKAYRLNADLPGRIAKRTRKRGIKLLHISTATVFDGQRGDYTEDDSPNPLSVYAKTKLEGENAVLAADPQALITRVSIFGWSPSGKRSLAEFFYHNLRQRNPVTGFTDVIFCPVLVNHCAPIFRRLFEGNYRGIFHVANPKCVSKYQFGRIIAKRFGFQPALVQPGLVGEADLVGDRSRNLTLKTERLAQEVKVQPPELSTGVGRFYTLFQQGYPQRLQDMVKRPPQAE